ncbi:hypothetical protein E2562_015831 [Oryza meyeriana var. granulata]|uniref:Uncharacterized protein n=1 Tax=Oryza meyeriana var. granulata TaxID=110450 RepID=A0A6G1D4I5_9ORYZ|nr:hypothetical protein E2562_015831 [Oryza meyeriana var. granulata]
MEMASARRPMRARQSDQIVLWGACVLLSALSLLLLAVSSGFGAARLTIAAGEISVLVRTTTSGSSTVDDVVVVAAEHCGVLDDDYNRLFVDGEWMRDDERRPLYEPWRCPFIDEGFRCRENGRPDDAFAKWRWQPRHCTLPRFDAENLLEKLRNRRLVFVGDSIGRNQWESMLCMLATAVAGDDKASIYEEKGSPITKHKGVLSFRFRDYNCTVEHYRSPYLVRRGRPPRRAPKHVGSTLQLDAMDSRAHRWKDADVVVFNTGHWWSHERLQQLHCYFQVGKKLRLDMSVEAAYQRAMSTLSSWVHREVSSHKSLVIFRTYSPAHPRASNSGSCALETTPELNSSRISLHRWPGMWNPAFEPSKSGTAAAAKLHVLNVTLMAAQRRDGHPSVYNVAPAARMPAGQRADCSHWCLPGVPDAWNELLYAVILKRFS